MKKSDAIRILEGTFLGEQSRFYDCNALQAINMSIEALHTEIIYCKDCQHYTVEGVTTRYGWCHENKRSVDEDDFCSYGER